MSSDEKTQFTRIALGLSGIVVGSQTAEIIWRTIEAIQQKKEKFCIMDTAKIEVLVKGKFDANKKVSIEKDEKKSEEKSVVPVVKATFAKHRIPIVSVGGRKITLTPIQKQKLKSVIARYGIDSKEAKAEMMIIASCSRTEKTKSGKFKQVNTTKK